MRRVLIVVPMLALAACGAVNSEPRDAGPAGSRTFAASGFDAVSLQGSDNVRVVRGPAASVVATGAARVLDKLDIRVEGSTLKVGRKRQVLGMGWSDDKGAMVTVTMPAIKAADVAGSGDMTVDRADSDVFKAGVTGSGSLSLAAVAVTNTKLSLSGSGNLTAAGTAQISEVSLAGSGDVDASKLASRTVDMTILGSGNARAAASDSAKIAIAGSGNATVTGTDKCSVSKSGSGEASCAR